MGKRIICGIFYLAILMIIKEFPTLMFLTYQTEFNPNYKRLFQENVGAQFIKKIDKIGKVQESLLQLCKV